MKEIIHKACKMGGFLAYGAILDQNFKKYIFLVTHNFFCDMWHMTCDTWHVTHDLWHVTHDMWHVVEGDHSLKIHEDWEEKADGLTDWITKVFVEQPRLYRVC